MNAETPGRLFGIGDDDVVLVVLPMFHVFGLSSELNVCVRFGATMSLVPRFEIDKVLDIIQRDRVTIFEGVPTMYISRCSSIPISPSTTSPPSPLGISGARPSLHRSLTPSRRSSASSSSRGTA